MNLEEYRAWLQENGNKEELMAYEVARKVIDYHLQWGGKEDWKADLHPRFWMNGEEEKLEFDLLIELEWTSSGKRYKRMIGIEFKEMDFRRVVNQAIARRDYVDYMWIATRNVFGSSDDYTVALLEMLDHGIGWVIWDEDFVKIIVAPRYNRYGWVPLLLGHIAEKAVERAAEKLVKDAKVSQGIRSLFEFIDR